MRGSRSSQLSSGFKIVNSPGTKMRTGLTDFIVSSNLDKPVVTFVSQVSFEREVLDSTSDERLSGHFYSLGIRVLAA